MKNWHVIQVIGGSEEKVINRIQHEDFHAFLPKRIRIQRRQGANVKIEEPLFRGYVFIETDKSYRSFRLHLHEVIRPVEGFIRLLKYDNEGLETILPEERQFIECFCDKQKVVQPSIGFIEGEKVVISEGPLLGQESAIKRIDRHKRTAELELTLFGQPQRVIVSLEVIEKV